MKKRPFDQYSAKIKTNYLSRQMFLDPAGSVTVQRFEDVAYPKIQKFEKMARGFFWVPEEISLTKDKQDFKNADEATQFVFTNQLLRLTVIDGLQGRAPAQIFTPVISVPELEGLVINWSYFETCIHSNSYSHIIRNVYNMPKEQFDSIHDNKPIVNMASNIGKYYNKLYELNCKKAVGMDVSEDEHIDAIWLALNSSFALEAIRFLTSFAVAFGMLENSIFLGNGNIISLIMQDEILHMDWTAYIINQVVKDDPRFARAKTRNEFEVYAMFKDVVREEKEWATYLFQKGNIVGLNEIILHDFVDHITYDRLKLIGIKWENAIKTSNLPWFSKHLNLSRKQTSLQEQESSNYIIGALGSELDIAKLPSLG